MQGALAAVALIIMSQALRGKDTEIPAESPIIKDAFDVKAVTTVMATPDEVFTAISDAELRSQWDPSNVGVTKAGENMLAAKYANSYAENLKFETFADKGGPHYVQEQVNGSDYRFYELQPVKNRPFILRVT